jgi:hypothetical protein
MSEPKTGDRVGAILSKEGKECKLLGYGVYEGDHPLEMFPGFMTDNPRIRLDSGETVWGWECWWGPEEKFKQELEKFTAGGGHIVNVSIEAVRREARGERVN